jgi:hypothetical protein
MYLRTTRRRNADGSEVRYYQLAENAWDPARRCAIAKVVYNFGRADELDAAKLKRLAKSIMRVFDGEEQLAAVEDVTVHSAWPYGGAYVLEEIWKEIGIDRLLKERLRAERIRQPFERALFAMVANRCLAPYSKLYCWEQWIREDVFLPSAASLELHHLYRAMDFFEQHKEEIEREIFFSMSDLLNADVDLIFYDTTSLHFEIDEEDSGGEVERFGRRYGRALRKRGHSKNGRSDAPQIVLGLAVTRDGLPVRSWVFSGETNDMRTIERVKRDLKGWRLGRCVFVGDAGMNSQENRHRLALGGGKYILASRVRAGDEVTKEVLPRPGRYRKIAENLEVKEVVIGDGERRRRYVVCHNPREEERQREHRKRLLEELQAELDTLAAPKRGGHSKRMCELISSGRFGRYLTQVPGTGLLINRSAVEEAERYDGKWVVTSNDDTLSAEDLALGYKQLMRVEQCWRSLKSGLRVRPVFHYQPWRIQAHVGIAVIALLLERIAETRAGDTWRNIRAALETIKVVEYERAGTRIHQTTDVRASVAGLLRALKIAPPPRLHAIEENPRKS